VVGGTAGGVLGSTIGGGAGRAAAVIAGTVLGAVVGGEIGRWMDAVDQACAAQTLEYAGTSRNVEWVNPDNGAVYQITPTETYRTAEDRYCREYRTEADIGGRKHEVYGTACRQPDGSWQLVHE
jgi:surface antigen